MKDFSCSLFCFLFVFFCFSDFLCHGIESPQFTIVRSESDFEIRLYSESLWMSASVQTDSFETATKEGFHRLYQYIHGANEDSSELEMTSPVLTSVAAEAQPSLEYFVRLFLSPKIEGGPPHPLSSLNLQLDKWGSRCIAVRKFSGFAQDENTTKEADSLLASLGRSNSTNRIFLDNNRTYTIAQYNSSSHLVERVNEVWMTVKGSATEGC